MEILDSLLGYAVAAASLDNLVEFSKFIVISRRCIQRGRVPDGIDVCTRAFREVIHGLDNQHPWVVCLHITCRVKRAQASHP